MYTPVLTDTGDLLKYYNKQSHSVTEIHRERQNILGTGEQTVV